MTSIQELRTEILRMAYRGQEGHVPSSLSILEIVWALYDGDFVTRESESKFVLSKGHGCLALYVVLAEKGWFPKEWLREFANPISRLGGHPDRTLIPGVTASTGSLGHGMPFACGLAYAHKVQGNPGKVFVLIGDGEANEGSIWETALLASHRKLENLVCIVDQNGSSRRAIDLGNLAAKFSSFGWKTSEVDGHSLEELNMALNRQYRAPHAIIARTIKGMGFDEMENNPAWHHTRISGDDLERFIGATGQ